MQIDCSVIANTLKKRPVIGWHHNFLKLLLLKSNRELWENLQQLIARAISISKMENSRAYKRMEENEIKEKWMNGDTNE